MLPEFLLSREVRLRLERVWNTMLTRRPTRATLFSSRSHQCKMPWSTTRWPWRWQPNLYNTRLGQSPQLNWRLPTNHGASPQWNVAPRWPLPSRAPMHPRVTRSTRKSGGNQIIFGGSVDRGLLFQTLENQQVVMARERDRARISFWASMVKLQ